MEEQKQKFNFQKLTPRDDITLDIYDNAIEYVFSNYDICNIALSGAYGAGKSSVIESYKKKHPDRRFIHISLAHFSDTDQKEEISVADLEGKIINQLVHLIPVERIPQTNFAVKRKVHMKSVLGYTFYIVPLFLLLSYLVFYNGWCNMVSGLSVKLLRDALIFTTKQEFVFISVLICAAMFCMACYEMVKWQMNRKLFSKVNLKGDNFSIELFDAQEASYFDRYLNEVLYLFENVKADAIVFEDMDRYNSKLIFEGLKEINTLLNRKRNLYFKQKKEPLRFIFLLRDDMFMTKERTKFFDYIIPVVPVIDGSNSYDKFIELFKEGGIVDLFDDDFLRGLSLYIDDMRILKNIVNEFVVYHEKLKGDDTEQNNNKLLAMISYKNMFPRDFVELQVSRGYVYQLFHIRDSFVQNQIRELQEEIRKLERAKAKASEEQLESLDELDAIYYVENSPTRVDGKRANEFSTRADYVAEIKKNHYDVEVNDPGYSMNIWRDTNIKDQFDALLSRPEYRERKKRIENKREEQQEQIEAQIAACCRKQDRLKSAYLKDVITKENADEFFEAPMQDRMYGVDEFREVKKDPYFPLIKYLIRNGYIDETYPDYMTFFYANSISRQDKVFLRSITDEKAKEYDYKLQDAKMVISRMRPVDFEAKECWNYDLLDTLLEEKDSGKYGDYLEKFLVCLRNEKPADFVEGYIRHRDNIIDFVQELNALWSQAVSWIVQEKHIDDEMKYRYIRTVLIESNKEELVRYNKGGILAEYIGQREKFLCFSNMEFSEIYLRRHPDDFLESKSEDFSASEENDSSMSQEDMVLMSAEMGGQKHIIDVFKTLDVKFTSIHYYEVNTELLEVVYSDNMYQLTWEMIDLFLGHMYNIESPWIHRAESLTLIFSQDQPLAEYVKNNLADFIDLQIACVEWLAEEESTVLYVLNHRELEEQQKRNYIRHLEYKLTELSAVEDKLLWKELIQGNISDSCTNLFDYFFFSGYGMDEALTHYINNYKRSLFFGTIKLEKQYHEGAGNNFFWQLIKNNDIENERYRQMVKSFDLRNQAFFAKGVDWRKMHILIQEQVIGMTLDNLHFLRKNYEKSVYEFIEGNIQGYIDIMMKEELVEEEIAHVLQMKVKDEQKIQLLKLETSPISVMHKNYTPKVIVYILQNLLDSNEREQLFMWYPDDMPDVQKEIKDIALRDIEEVISEKMKLEKTLLTDLLIGHRISMKNKKMLLANNLSGLGRNDMEICLKLLGLEESIQFLEGGISLFEKSDANASLLNAFQEKGWISDYEIDQKDGNYYIAYGSKEEKKNIS